jgi:hypothetical protein
LPVRCPNFTEGGKCRLFGHQHRVPNPKIMNTTKSPRHESNPRMQCLEPGALVWSILSVVTAL